MSSRGGGGGTGTGTRYRRSWMSLALCLWLVISARGDDGEGAQFSVRASSYGSFYDEVHELAQVGSLYEGHVVTGVLDPAANQKEDPPNQWLNVTVIGDGTFRAKMMLRGDNLYFLAFLNKLKKLFFIRGYGKLFQGLGGTELPFGETYSELLGPGGGAYLLVNLPLGREAATSAAQIMSEYDPETCPDEDIKRAIAIMLVMGPEAFRFHDVRGVFADNLDAETHLEVEHIEQILNWGPMSVAFFCKDQEPEEHCMTSALTRSLEAKKLDDPNLWGVKLDIMQRPRRMALDGRIIRRVIPDAEKPKAGKKPKGKKKKNPAAVRRSLREKPKVK